MSETITEILGWLGAFSEVLFLVGGLVLGYLSQFFLDRSSAKRSAAAQLRQERQKVHVAFHTQVRQFLHDAGYLHHRGVDEGQEQHRPFVYNSRPIYDLLPAVELLADPATYSAAEKVATACSEYDEHAAIGVGKRIDEASLEYLDLVRKELNLNVKKRDQPETPNAEDEQIQAAS